MEVRHAHAELRTHVPLNQTEPLKTVVSQDARTMDKHHVAKRRLRNWAGVGKVYNTREFETNSLALSPPQPKGIVCEACTKTKRT